MKKILVNILCSTAITLLILAVVGTIFDARCLFINSVFQSFFVNIVIHTGLLLTRKFESSYAILELTLDICYIEITVIIFGTVFDWYSSIPVSILVIMTSGIYIAGVFLNVVQTRQEVEEINKLLQKRENH